MESFVKNQITALRENLETFHKKMNILRVNKQLQNSDLIYYLNLDLLIDTLKHYESYMISKIFEILKKESGL